MTAQKAWRPHRQLHAGGVALETFVAGERPRYFEFNGAPSKPAATFDLATAQQRLRKILDGAACRLVCDPSACPQGHQRASRPFCGRPGAGAEAHPRPYDVTYLRRTSRCCPCFTTAWYPVRATFERTSSLTAAAAGFSQAAMEECEQTAQIGLLAARLSALDARAAELRSHTRELSDACQSLEEQRRAYSTRTTAAVQEVAISERMRAILQAQLQPGATSAASLKVWNCSGSAGTEPASAGAVVSSRAPSLPRLQRICHSFSCADIDIMPAHAVRSPARGSAAAPPVACGGPREYRS